MSSAAVVIAVVAEIDVVVVVVSVGVYVHFAWLSFAFNLRLCDSPTRCGALPTPERPIALPSLMPVLICCRRKSTVRLLVPRVCPCRRAFASLFRVRSRQHTNATRQLSFSYTSGAKKPVAVWRLRLRSNCQDTFAGNEFLVASVITTTAWQHSATQYNTM